MEISQKLSLVAAFALILGLSQTPSFAGCGSSKIAEETTVVGTGAIAVQRTAGNVTISGKRKKSKGGARRGSIDPVAARATHVRRLSAHDIKIMRKREHQLFLETLCALEAKYYFLTYTYERNKTSRRETLEKLKSEYRNFFLHWHTKAQGKLSQYGRHSYFGLNTDGEFHLKLAEKMLAILDSKNIAELITAQQQNDYYIKIKQGTAQAQKDYFFHLNPHETHLV